MKQQIDNIRTNNNIKNLLPKHPFILEKIKMKGYFQ
jgi:hypothetical protein